MSEQQSGGVHINIGGSASGDMVGLGQNITQTKTTDGSGGVTEAELAELQRMLADLKAQVAAVAPAEKQ